jgi:hypothetical protein
MMTLESRDKLDSTLTPRALNLTLESEMSRELLDVSWMEVEAPFYSFFRLVLGVSA